MKNQCKTNNGFRPSEQQEAKNIGVNALRAAMKMPFGRLAENPDDQSLLCVLPVAGSDNTWRLGVLKSACSAGSMHQVKSDLRASRPKGEYPIFMLRGARRAWRLL